jgi:acyl-CoA thioesterase FadM
MTPNAVETRWTDVDAFGHVHHIALVEIAGHACSQWLHRILDAGEAWPYAVVHIAFDYRSQIRFEDKLVSDEAHPLDIGRTSVRLAERLRGPDSSVVAEGETVIVAWDQAQGATRLLTDDESRRLRSLVRSAD